MMTSEDIKRRLWEGANELRGSMDARRYKDYKLGLMFYCINVGLQILMMVRSN